MQRNDIGYYFIVMASIVIVLAGIKSASEIIVPFLLSLFLAIILSPIFNFFQRKGLGSGLSLSIVISGFLLILIFVGKLIGTSAHEFNLNINSYTQQLSTYYIYITNLLNSVGIEVTSNDIFEVINSKQAMNFASSVIQSMGSIFTNSFVILLTLVFMMLESTHFIDKISYTTKNTGTFKDIEKIAKQIKEYMVIKALISFLTGFIIYISLLFIGVDYPFLWAVLAFILNFIPNIGSLIAALPVIFLSLVQLGVIHALIVSAVYTMVNVIVGSIIEPKVMGKGLGLSTLVVFLSLIFWGWLLGIVGMLLSIPLTIMLKIILDSKESTRWIAILLGTSDQISRANK